MQNVPDLLRLLECIVSILHAGSAKKAGKERKLLPCKVLLPDLRLLCRNRSSCLLRIGEALVTDNQGISDRLHRALRIRQNLHLLPLPLLWPSGSPACKEQKHCTCCRGEHPERRLVVCKKKEHLRDEDKEGADHRKEGVSCRLFPLVLLFCLPELCPVSPGKEGECHPKGREEGGCKVSPCSILLAASVAIEEMIQFLFEKGSAPLRVLRTPYLFRHVLCSFVPKFRQRHRISHLSSALIPAIVAHGMRKNSRTESRPAFPSFRPNGRTENPSAGLLLILLTSHFQSCKDGDGAVQRSARRLFPFLRCTLGNPEGPEFLFFFIVHFLAFPQILWTEGLF